MLLDAHAGTRTAGTKLPNVRRKVLYARNMSEPKTVPYVWIDSLSYAIAYQK
jgi:hypothetical protein